jgi:rhamnosyltransferase
MEVMPTSPKVSVIIRCFNEGKHIGRLLRGIEEQTVRDVEVIVVDSGSTDTTLEVVAKSRAKLVTLKPEEFSFGRALNLGCATASGDFLVIASAHVYPVYRTWLERLLAPLVDPTVALAYGRQRGDEARSKFSERQLFEQWFPRTSDMRQRQPFCNNANAAIRRTQWQMLPYDEEITGLEDLQWAKRVIALGYRLAYVADAEVVHLHEEGAAQVLNRYRREAIAMKKLYPSHSFSLTDFLVLTSANVLSDSYHALRQSLLKEHAREILRFRVLQFWGTYLGYAQKGPVSRELKSRFYYPKGFRHADEAPLGPDRIQYDARLEG